MAKHRALRDTIDTDEHANRQFHSGIWFAPLLRMFGRWNYAVKGRRDLRIDWLRGLAMTCVIVDHSKMSSLLSWFSYERFWVVTAAEVFVVLSGIVLGMVYGQKVVRSGWLAVVRGLGRRALTLYVAFLAVTVSILVISLAGIDVSSLTTWDDNYAGFVWFIDPGSMNAAAWRDVALMRFGPWAFQIVGLYVWLVAATVPCLIALNFAGWRPLLAVSWCLYLWYRLAPHALTTGEFESTFPILVWQLLFVHGLAIGYHRERLTAFVARCPRFVPVAVAGAAGAFIVFALCNPWMDGPPLLHWDVVSPERFTQLYFHYFTLTDLGIGRLLNLAVALPVGYALLTWGLDDSASARDHLCHPRTTIAGRIRAARLRPASARTHAGVTRGRLLDQHRRTGVSDRRDRRAAERRSTVASPSGCGAGGAGPAARSLTALRD